jgi:hypothetical protein
MSGLLLDQDDQVVDGQHLARSLRQRDVSVVRRIEGPAEDPDHESSTTSSPIAI